MGKKNKEKDCKKSSLWIPPKGASAYFSPASDYEFKKKHPIGYFFFVILGMVALFLPSVLYLIFAIHSDANSHWILLGWFGGFIIGIGFFNFVTIIIRQYLGHLVSILSFIIGGMLILISLVQMGIV